VSAAPQGRHIQRHFDATETQTAAAASTREINLKKITDKNLQE